MEMASELSNRKYLATSNASSKFNELPTSETFKLNPVPVGFGLRGEIVTSFYRSIDVFSIRLAEQVVNEFFSDVRRNPRELTTAKRYNR